MKFITADQRSPAWFAARLGRVTGSRFKDVMAISKKTGEPLKAREDYRKELVTERILGDAGKKEVFMTDAMRWGQLNESLARTQYSLMTGNKVTEEGFIQHDDLMVGVSTDGLVTSGSQEGNLEIKCLEPHNHLYNIAMNNAMPDDYRDQVQGQMWITGRPWCDFVGYDSRMPDGLDLFVTRILRDEDYIMQLEAEIMGFLAEVERDFRHFLRYLPTAERVCRACGTMFIDKINLCPECMSNQCAIKKILQPAELRLLTIEEKEAMPLAIAKKV